MAYDADAIIVGAGLAGLVAAAELVEAGKRDHRSRSGARAVAGWSGVLVARRVVSGRLAGAAAHAHPRFARLALEDWMGTAAFDRDEDFWPRQWAEAYVAFAAGEKRAWLHERGHPLLPGRRLGRARRAQRHRPRQFGAALPSHLGNRPGSGRALHSARARGGEAGTRRLQVPPSGQRADRSPAAPSTACAATSSNRRPSGAARRVRARWPAASSSGRRRSSSPPAASAPVMSWYARTGRSGSDAAPERMISGVPDHVDGRMLAITEAAGGTIINPDRMWHYVEGIKNWNPIWTAHAHPHPARSVIALARRARPAAAGAPLPRLRHARHAQAHHGDRLRLFLVRAHSTDHREGVRAIRFGAESGFHRARAGGRCWAARSGGVPGPVKAFMDKGEDFIVERRARRRW